MLQPGLLILRRVGSHQRRAVTGLHVTPTPKPIHGHARLQLIGHAIDQPRQHAFGQLGAAGSRLRCRAGRLTSQSHAQDDHARHCRRAGTQPLRVERLRQECPERDCRSIDVALVLGETGVLRLECLFNVVLAEDLAEGQALRLQERLPEQLKASGKSAIAWIR